MPRKHKHDYIIDKKIFKISAGHCRICGEKDQALLDVHRIKQGCEGGKYNKSNSVCVCVRCHRRIHDGQISIDRYYFTTDGYKLRIFIDGEELFI